jgi:3D (Asp-Asp-Asp) domain-containing protein
MEATAYDPGPKSCGKWASGYTATGAKAEKGIVAVDDRVIPMGTRMYIPGYGFALAADRGGAIKGMRIDLCYPTYAEAIQFGRRKVKVYLLD